MKRILLSLVSLLSATLLFAQTPINWTVDEVNPGYDFTLSADEEIFTEGTISCHMQLNSGAVPYLISDNFNVNPGSSYRFSISVLDNDTLGQLKLYCDFYDAIGNNIFGEEPVFSTDKSVWQTIEWVGTVPPDAVEGYVLIKFYCQPGLTTFIDKADIWVDNCSFVEQGGSNMVVNGSFEYWAVGIGEPVTQTGVYSVFPNPADDFITVKTSENVDVVRISDLSGRVVIEQRMTGNIMKIDISSLPPGLFLININHGNQQLGGLKLAKQ